MAPRFGDPPERGAIAKALAMMEQYKHTQIGWVILFAIGAAILLISLAYFGNGHHANWLGYSILVVLGIAALLFCSLTVTVADGLIRIKFGPGLIRKTFALKNIERHEVVKTPWYYGWGIRKIPGGWLHNVSGLMSVELTMRDGKKYRIGTDAPEELAQAIDRALRSDSSNS